MTMFVSYAMWLEINLLAWPNAAQSPEWRKERERVRRDWMKRCMRSRSWPWSAGPTGKLP